MINEETFRKAEDILGMYYTQLKEIDKLQHRVNVLEIQQERIKQNLREININVEFENKSIEYNQERVQNASLGVSYAKAEAGKKITKFKELLKHTRNQIVKIRFRIREIEKENTKIESSIRVLGEVYRKGERI